MADFTEIYKQSNNLCSFSPDGDFIATAVQQRLVVREVETLQIQNLFNCLDNIQDLMFSPDSTLILCASYRCKSFQVYSMIDEKWTAEVDEGLAGLTKCMFSPDSRHVLGFSDFNLRITIWSLINGNATYIQFPKYSDRGYCFRSDGKYFCTAERIESKDYISIYDCSDWTMIKRWPCDTFDLYNLAWSPCGRYIACWEYSIQYRILIYYPDGRLISTYCPYENRLGIKQVKWSPSGQFLSIGAYDETCCLLNCLTWTPLIKFEHTQKVDGDVQIFNEINTEAKNWNSTAQISYEPLSTPFSLFQTKLDIDKPNPKIGISVIEYSATGHMLATRNDHQPNTLWIWDMLRLELIVVINQSSPIKSVKWNPLFPQRLALCCGNGAIYLWDSEFGSEAIQVPAVNFQVNAFKWNPNGKSLLLMDKDKFCVAFLIDE